MWISWYTLLGKSSPSLLRNSLSGEGVICGFEGIIRVGQDYWCHLILWIGLGCWTKILRFILKNSLPGTVRNGVDVIDFAEFDDIGVH